MCTTWSVGDRNRCTCLSVHCRRCDHGRVQSASTSADLDDVLSDGQTWSVGDQNCCTRCFVQSASTSADLDDVLASWKMILCWLEINALRMYCWSKYFTRSCGQAIFSPARRAFNRLSRCFCNRSLRVVLFLYLAVVARKRKLSRLTLKSESLLRRKFKSMPAASTQCSKNKYIMEYMVKFYTALNIHNDLQAHLRGLADYRML